MEKPCGGRRRGVRRPARLLGPDDALNLAPAAVLCIDQTFARQDALVRERAAIASTACAAPESPLLLVSHEEELLRRLADEVWWLHEGKTGRARRSRGDARRLPQAHRRSACAPGARRLRAAARAACAPGRRPRRGAARRNHRRGRPSHHGVAQRRTGRGEGPGAIPRGGGGPGGRHDDPHAHRAERLRHQYGAGAAEARARAPPAKRWRSPSPSAASCARRSTPSRWHRTIPTACGTTGWRMRWRSP